MLERVAHTSGVVTYRSSLLADIGVVHAFSTRIGGVSVGPFTSLNLGNPSDQPEKDSQENLLQNYERLQNAIGAAGMPRAWVQQIHSIRVELLDAEEEGEYTETLDAVVRDRFGGQLQADAMVTQVPNVLLSVRVADCVPVLLASSDGRTVAAVHAGWRGVVNGVLARTLRALGEIGVSPQNLIAAIGPSISLAHFEVGPEVANFFNIASLSSAVDAHGFSKPHIDLTKALIQQLGGAGVKQIDAPTTPQLCTFTNSTDFFSHRRDHGLTGRMAAVITCRPA